METLGSILQQLLGGNPKLREALRLEQLQKYWPQVADDRMTGKVQPYDYKNRTLFLSAGSAVWAQQIAFYKQVIIDKYKNLLPGVEIKDIRVSAARGVLPASGAASGASIIEMPVTDLEPPEDGAPLSLQAKLQRIIRKAARLAGLDRRPVCPQCGQRFEGAQTVCVFCRNTAQKAREAEIAAYLAEAPWAKYPDIHADWPEIAEEDFWQAKQKLQQQTLDALQRLFFEFYKQKPSAPILARAEQLAVKYTLLKTGLTPAQINDNILASHLKRNLYKFIRGGYGRA